MAPSMKASFSLNLGGDLSKGLIQIKDDLINLRDVGKQIALDKIEKIPGIMHTVTDAIRGTVREMGDLSSEMRGVEANAERAGGAMRRLASIGRGAANFGKQALGPGGLMGAATAVGGAAAIIAPSRAYASYENIARHSAITEGLSGAAANAESKRLMGVFNRDAVDAGQSSESIAQAYQDLIQTGIKPGRAEALLPIHSRAATAYNISPEALGHAVFALSDSFKIDETGMGGALASMALASKAGRFKVEDFSHYLPGIGGDFAKLGMTGRGSADIAFASLETVMKNAADPSQGAANFKDFMNAITSPHSARSFALESRGMAPETKAMLARYHVQGINLPRLLENARNRGIDPLTAVVRTLSSVTSGLPADVKAEVLGAYLGNQQARDAAQSLLSHPGEYQDLLKNLHGADAGLLDRDFQTAHAAPMITNNTGEEVGKQIERRVGEGFQPIMDRLTDAGKSLLGGIGGLDQKFPGLADAVLVVTGGMIALGAALAGIGFVAPAVGAGAGILAAGFGMAATGAGGVLLGLSAVGMGAAYALGQKGYQIPWVDPNTGMPSDIDMTGGSSQSPISFSIPGNDMSAGQAARSDEPVSIDLTVRTDPGTSVHVNQQSHGGHVRINPGSTTTRE